MRFVPLAAWFPFSVAPRAYAAQENLASPSEISACRKLEDPLERAGCYDQLLGGPHGVATAPATPPSVDESAGATFYVRVFSGYGESLIAYNHSQATVGVDVLVIDLL